MLIAASASAFGLLGGIHLLYTFRGNRFDARDPVLNDALKVVSPVISRETTMWRAAKGFNASHSFGMMSFALIYGDLAGWHASFLLRSAFLLALGMIMLLAYLALARRYWFSSPFRGIVLACALYAAGLAVAVFSR